MSKKKVYLRPDGKGWRGTRSEWAFWPRKGDVVQGTDLQAHRKEWDVVYELPGLLEGGDA